MSILTSYMEAALAAATDPVEIESRRNVLTAHREMSDVIAEKEAQRRAVDVPASEGDME